jgi:hypothetical protein
MADFKNNKDSKLKEIKVGSDGVILSIFSSSDTCGLASHEAVANVTGLETS